MDPAVGIDTAVGIERAVGMAAAVGIDTEVGMACEVGMGTEVGMTPDAEGPVCSAQATSSPVTVRTVRSQVAPRKVRNERS